MCIFVNEDFSFVCTQLSGAGVKRAQLSQHGQGCAGDCMRGDLQHYAIIAGVVCT